MNNYQMDAILYDPQQNFSKYLEINKYVIPGGYLHNPLITLNPLHLLQYNPHKRVVHNYRKQ